MLEGLLAALGFRRKPASDWRADVGGLARSRPGPTPIQAVGLSSQSLKPDSTARVIPHLWAGSLEEHTEAAKAPYSVVRLNLAAAGAQDFAVSGNVISVLRLVGANPEIRFRFESAGADAIPITDRATLSGAFTWFRVEWDAIVGGAADLQIGWTR